MGPIGGLTTVDGHDRQLLPEQIDAGFRQRQVIRGVVRFVEAEVMIILGPIGRDAAEELDHAGEPKLLMPAFAQLRDRLRHAHGIVVVNDIARADEEVGAQRQHRLERRESEAFVRVGGGQRPAGFPQTAMHEFVVIHATADDEAHRGVRPSAGQRLE